MDLYQEFFSLVEQNDRIVIFGHVYPDGDCYSSSEALKLLLQDLYPQKSIKVTGTDIGAIPQGFPRADDVSDEDIESALHIFVDLSDKKRCGDPRGFALKGKGIVKIDHHAFSEEFGGLEIIEDSLASCTALLYKIFISKYASKPFPKMVASLLATGIITDSGRFQFAYSSDLFAAFSRLVQDGADIEAIYAVLNVTSEKVIKFKGYMYSHYQKTFFGVAYCKIPYKDGHEYGFEGHSAALFVNSIGYIDASKIFVTFGEDADGKIFVELRSFGNYDVHAIAVKFHGGGHFNASGCTASSWEETDRIIEECEKTILASFAPYSSELAALVSLGQQASKKIMEIYNKGFEIEIKSDNSPVTDADKASDLLIKKGLLEAFPSYGILTEEDADDKIRLEKDKVFIIDPLDGTSDFVKKDGQFAINLALVDHHVPVVGVVVIPATGAVYFAVKEHGAYLKEEGKMIRSIHASYRRSSFRVLASSCHKNEYLESLMVKHASQIEEEKSWGSAWKACLISEGKAEIAINIGAGTKEWDTCAPQCIVLEAGGIFTDTKGQVISYNRDDVYNRNGYITLANPNCAIISFDELAQKQ